MSPVSGQVIPVKGAATASTHRSSATAHNGHGWGILANRRKSGIGRKAHSKRKRITLAQAFTLCRRVMIIASAFLFIYIELVATIKTASVLRGEDIPAGLHTNYKSHLLSKYLGSGRIRDSPLLMDVLGNDTTPRDGSIFISAEDGVSFEQCSVAKRAGLYDRAKLRSAYVGLARSTAYNFTYMNEIELIAPVIDCSFEGMLAGDISLARVYFLVNNKSNPNDVILLGMALSLQEYKIPDQDREGPTYVGVVSLVNDMRATIVKSDVFISLDYPFLETTTFYACERAGLSRANYRILRTIPRNGTTDIATTIHTARRRGFYFHAETEQSNVVVMYRRIETKSPLLVLTELPWEGKPVITDSWAWVHGIHYFFALQTMLSMVVLFVIIVRNWQQGRIWIGDAFAAFSNRILVARLVLVLASWHVNEYWVLTEFALANAVALSGKTSMTIHDEFVASDMLTIMFGIMSMLGWLTSERVDPAFAMLLFTAVHYNRLSIIRLSPSIVDYLTKYADEQMLAGIVDFPDAEARVTPFRPWTTYRLKKVDFKFLVVSFFPKFVIIGIVIVYIIARKIYHRFYPDQVLLRSAGSRGATKSSNNSDRESQEKHFLTIFEIATGAVLRARFGLISDYNNYVMIKGLKFASADGIYCSGYVIANGKFLVATGDIFSIVLMKLLRMRFYNVYAYEVNGTSVQQTARLVYPDTLSWTDLSHLNTSTLS